MSEPRPRLYGISNCDQVRKARAWFAEHRCEIEFHDFKKQGLSQEILDRWLQHVPWDALLNRRGTTWRALDEARRGAVVDNVTASELMMERPSLVKRPVIELGNQLVIGFHPDLYAPLVVHSA
jgi:arsenate reductase